MALVKHEDSASWVKLWIDGYAPDTSELESYAEAVWPGQRPEFCIANPQGHREAWFNVYHHRLVDWASDYLETHQVSDRDDPTLDLYLLSPEVRYDSAIPEPVREASREEVGNDRFTQALVTFSAVTYRQCVEAAESLLAETGFRVKTPDQYRDYCRFKAGCEDMIGRLGLAYWNPEALVAESLVSLGFTKALPGGLFDVRH